MIKATSIKATIVAALLSVSATAFAEPVVINCESFSEMAAKVMEARQAEVPRQKMVKAIGDNPLFLFLIQEAYKYSILPAEEYKQRYIQQFSDNIYNMCVKVNDNEMQAHAFRVPNRSHSE